MSIFKTIMQGPSGNDFVGAPSFANWNPGYGAYDFYKSDAYASAFPVIRPIVNDFMMIQPYTINGKGESVESAVKNALYHPNKRDSSVAFFEKLAVMALTHKKTYLLVWRREGKKVYPGGTITPQNIGGFTFLESPSIERREGRTYYKLGTTEYDEDEVIEIPAGVDPNNLYNGYAPSEASVRWAKLDDYIADYQAGFFENGAVSAGQFIITAATKEDFDNTVDMMQSRHRGAGNNNNVTYTPRPVDPVTGKPSDAKIEWIPFAQPNKDIDFKNLFDQTSKRMATTYGVSGQVQGVDDAATYANAQVSEAGFAKRAVRPLAVRIYTQITHELNRITNGLGCAITFTYDIPAVADEKKVVAETKAIEVDNILKLIEKGYSLESAVDALELDDSYKKLNILVPAANDDTNADVDEGGEVNNTPDPHAPTATIRRPNSHYENFNNETDEEYQLRIEKAAKKLLKNQVDKAIADQKEEGEVTNEVTGDVDPEALETFKDEMIVIVSDILIVKGAIQYEEGKQIILNADLITDALSEFKLTEAQTEAYRTYLTNVAQSYSDDTQAAIQSVLEKARAEGLTSAEIQKGLKELANLEEYRVVRLGRTETVRANNTASLYGMEQIQDDTGYSIRKIWNTGSANPCEFCRALDGTSTSVGNSFVPVGGTIEGDNGGIFVNTFVDMDVSQAHPNCGCYMTFEVA